MVRSAAQIRRLLVVICILAGLTVLVAAVISTVTLVQQGQVERNTTRIDRNERRDVLRSNQAAARICARENLVRAEVHVAYQAGSIDLGRVRQFGAAEPLLVQLLRLSEGRRHVSLKRVRTLLPILDCSPNLTGRPAKALLPCAQREFVNLYLAGKLDPLPGAGSIAVPVKPCAVRGARPFTGPR